MTTESNLYCYVSGCGNYRLRGKCFCIEHLEENRDRTEKQNETTMTNSTEKTKGHTPFELPLPKPEYDNSDERSGGQWFTMGPIKIQFSYSESEEEYKKIVDYVRLSVNSHDALVEAGNAMLEGVKAHNAELLGMGASLMEKALKLAGVK